jgi:glutamine cyclotransferase
VKLRCEKEFPHDPEVFTQGLEMLDSRTVLESGGLYGRSHVRVWDLASGRVLRRRDNAASHFGEGVTVFNNTVYQLTWMERVVNLFDPMDLAPRGSLQLPRKLREGWGLAHTEDALVMSDGSERLHFLDPLSLVQRRSVLVRAWRLANSAKKQQKKKQVKAASDAPELIGVPRLNELEVIDGYIYANIWHSPLIAVVSPETGIVQQWLDCSELLESGAAAYAKNPEAVLNGIAFDAASRRIFVTGKLWPAVLQCELPPLE